MLLSWSIRVAALWPLCIDFTKYFLRPVLRFIDRLILIGKGEVDGSQFLTHFWGQLIGNDKIIALFLVLLVPFFFEPFLQFDNKAIDIFAWVLLQLLQFPLHLLYHVFQFALNYPTSNKHYYNLWLVLPFSLWEVPRSLLPLRCSSKILVSILLILFSSSFLKSLARQYPRCLIWWISLHFKSAN